MNTADILTQCRRIPGVRVETDEREAALFLNSPEGTGEMRFVPVFPGVTLAQISVSAPVWPAPQLEGAGPESRGPLIVNYCAKGRCELVLNDNRRVFLSAGEVSLTERFAQDEYIYPGRSYEGIELFIDPETAAGGCGPVSALFGLDLSRLQKTYCPAGETYLAKFPLPAALSRQRGGLGRRASDGGPGFSFASSRAPRRKKPPDRLLHEGAGRNRKADRIGHFP